MPQTSPVTGAREYIVQLRAAKLKRSRRPRGEPTLYPETVHLLDTVLRSMQPGERLFPFGYCGATKMFRAAVRRSGATTMPNGQIVRWKDLRSGMACHLLRMGWTTDEVNARLGHTPRSEALDAYINFLALSRPQPRQRVQGALAEIPGYVPKAHAHQFDACPHCARAA